MGEGKELKYKTSRIAYIHNYILTALLIFFLTLILPAFEFTPLISQLVTIALIFLAMILLFEPETERVLRQYSITNNEVAKIEGLVTKKNFAIPYQSVADVRVIKGIEGRIFNFGDVIVKGMKEDLVMKGVKEPDVIYRIIENKIALMKRGPAKKGAKSEKAD